MTIYVGSIVFWPSRRIPRYLLPCAGQSLQIKEHRSLFSLIGNKYGGDGVSFFKLPDLRGRVIIGSNSSEERFSLGSSGGEVSVSLTIRPNAKTFTFPQRRCFQWISSFCQ